MERFTGILLVAWNRLWRETICRNLFVGVSKNDLCIWNTYIAVIMQWLWWWNRKTDVITWNRKSICFCHLPLSSLICILLSLRFLWLLFYQTWLRASRVMTCKQQWRFFLRNSLFVFANGILNNNNILVQTPVGCNELLLVLSSCCPTACCCGWLLINLLFRVGPRLSVKQTNMLCVCWMVSVNRT